MINLQQQLVTLLIGIIALSFACKKPAINKSNTDAESTAKTLWVAYYNVENLFDTENDPRCNDEEFLPDSKKEWTPERYQKKLQHIRAVLDSINTSGFFPDIIGLEEIENQKTLTDLVQTLNQVGTTYAFAHFDSPDERCIDVALLYNTATFELGKSTSIPIALPDPRDKTRDILYVNGKVGGEPLHIFVNHWPSRRTGEKESEEKRVAAAQTLRNQVETILQKDSQAKIIIGGDFNDHPDNISLEKTLGASPDAASHSLLVNLLYTSAKNGEGSHSYKGSWGMLDQIIVSPSITNSTTGVRLDKTAKASVFKRDFILFKNSQTGEVAPNKTYGGDKYYGGYSDHLPVFVKLSY